MSEEIIAEEEGRNENYSTNQIDDNQIEKHGKFRNFFRKIWKFLCAYYENETKFPNDQLIAPSLDSDRYLEKMLGKELFGPPRRVRMTYCLLFLASSFIAMSIIGILNQYGFKRQRVEIVYASLGATSVLVFAAATSPFSQPRNVIGGTLLSSLIGVTITKLFHTFSSPSFDAIWFAAALSVSISIFVMALTKTTHPPAGATALIATIGGKEVWELGYIFVPIILMDLIILLLVAIILNNIFKAFSYPSFWL